MSRLNQRRIFVFSGMVLALLFTISIFTDRGVEGVKKDKKSKKEQDERGFKPDRNDERGFRPGLPASRSFYMGVTPGSYDLTEGSLEDTYRFIEDNTDLIAHHFDKGIPWPEALERKPYHSKVESEINVRTKHLNRKQKVYISITPVRDGLALYWGKEESSKRPGKWKDKRIDDPEVLTAYLNFARDLIRRFHPDFMAYGIEVNTMAKNKDQWSKFVTLARDIYTTLKRENPRLPLFLTFQIDEYWNNEREQREAIRQILPYTDYMAVSLYPYFSGYFDPHKIPEGYISKVAALAPEKPFAVAETGFIAKDLDALGKKGPGSEDWQNDYMKFLLNESNKLNARFAVWFVSRDYDRLWNKIKIFSLLNKGVEVYKVWLHAGLLDGNGNRRKAFDTWSQWLRLPKR